MEGSRYCTICKISYPKDLMREDKDFCIDCSEWFYKYDSMFESDIHSNNIDQITEKIFLGKEEGQLNKKKLQELGITHILIAGSGLSINHPENFIYKQLNLDDLPLEDITSFFEETYEFIEKSEKIFIHCAAGVSRSPTIVISYLMRKNNISYDSAVQLVQSKRPCICPNQGFVSQLIKYQRVLGIKD